MAEKLTACKYSTCPCLFQFLPETKITILTKLWENNSFEWQNIKIALLYANAIGS